MTDWQKLLADHKVAVWRTIYRILPDYADASDCCQETFLDALQYERRQPVADWLSLLKCIATKRAIDRRRQNMRARARMQRADNDDSVKSFGSSKECPVELAYASELMERVRAGLTQVAEKQATALWLSCIEGLTHRQISEQMGIKENEVGVLVHRARVALEEIVRPNNAEERVTQ